MANYSAGEVKKLRDLTGSGMMDCKRALEDSDGASRGRPSSCCASRVRRTSTSARAASTANGLVVGRGRHDGRAQLRDRLRGQERRLPGARRQDPARRRRPRIPLIWPRSRPLKLDEWHRRGGRCSACAARIGEKLELQALHPRRRPGGALPAPPRLGPAARDRRARGLRRQRQTSWPRASRCTSRRPARSTATRDDVPSRRASRTSDASPRRPRARRASPSRSSRKHRRWPDQRLLQGRGAPGAAVRAGAEEDREGPVSTPRASPSRSSPASRSARPDRMTDVRIDPDARPGFGRVLLKLGGEMFGGGVGRGRSRRRGDGGPADRRGRRIRRHPGCRRHRWRQLLPRRRAAATGAWTAPAPTTWACSAPS